MPPFSILFTNTKKIQGSNVIKQDGFSDYLNHGVNILGLQAVRKLEHEKSMAMSIGCAIIFIEFPTALLIAETFMLSQTKFEISAIEDLMAKLD